MAELAHDICRLQYTGRTNESYGGSQSAFSNRTLSRCGCGDVAALEVLAYLSRFRGCRIDFLEDLPQGSVSAELYEEKAELISKKYFPAVYPLGVTVFGMALGMNAVFTKYRLPYRAVWGVRPGRLRCSIEEMLDSDIPVIMAAGKNFPNIFGKESLALYRYGTDHRAGSVRAHYYIVTALEGDKMTISSWGRKYTVSFSEFETYASAVSNPFLSSILYIKCRNWTARG